MKKYLLLLILLLIPFGVFAAPVEYPYTIETYVNLQGKDIEAGEFTFELRNDKGEVIDTATNDKDGKVVFKTLKNIFDIRDMGRSKSCPSNQTSCGYNSHESENIFYTINIVNNKDNHYQLDNEIVYVGVGAGKYSTDAKPIVVNYLKNPESLNVPGPTKKDAKIFHATEEELWGEAYIVFDPETKIATYFRDEPGKYSYNQEVDGKYYINQAEPTKEDDSNWWSTNYLPYDYKSVVKKIIIKDPIKIQGNRSYDMFDYMPNLEEIEGLDKVDTSDLVMFDYMFYNDYSLKTIDLSTWDTSNAKSMYYMFAYCYSLEELYIDNFDTSKVESWHYFLTGTPSLKHVNISNLDFSSAMNGATYSHADTEYFTYYGGTESLDFTGVNFGSLMNRRILNYMLLFNQDAKYVNLPYRGKMSWGVFYDADSLSVVKIGNRNEYPLLETYEYEGVQHDKRDFESILDQSDSYWYFPNSNITLISSDFVTYMKMGYVPIKDDEGNEIGRNYIDIDTTLAIRPRNNPTPSTFNIIYTKEEVKGVEEIKENPKTGVFKNTFTIIVLLLISFKIYKVYSKKTYYNRY